ncbi:Glycosyl hydrolases family 35 [Roseateles sp. YR242]|uniref:beta-galactosidase n=1 Tax=Roseateles sp. YR242 TaxID=1855305 RepID=UPI0008CD5505|nr:beta-galactosidase [Roseateles sp. YR242]SEL35525.1 Glycosyl hydrolases family 35 [Roseateles sp. YR242]
MSETTFPVVVPVPATFAAPEVGFLNLGHFQHPTRRLDVNSRYLSLDGKPWMPVMGEFHYSRFPQAEWATELAKMKAGGVDIVASYVIWNHHEPFEGQWLWEGQRHLSRFIDLAAEAGLLVYLRPGPWVHAEVRLGGFPDWLPATGPLRCNDPVYLGHVKRFYEQIGAQVKGRLWSDGGPIVGLQLENEYGATGPGQGKEHIAELKRLAIEAGMTVPLYTVTGWPTLDIPPQEVLPVSGAYADGFWQGSREALPPSGVFLFNTRRVIGEMGNVDGTPAAGLIDTEHYPFCLAEAGGGMHQSYHRRPVITTEDVYATTLVQLGSGANLYGYYMYHGGTNPVCETGPLNETQASGYPNDVPQWGYDFHAPLGQYGQVRPSWGRLRTLHQFMQAFGDTLAPLVAVLPASGPLDPANRDQARVSVRAAGADAASVEGFMFVNHHVRHHPLPAMPGQQWLLQTQQGEPLRLPSDGGVDLRPGMAFIWPVGQKLGRVRMRQATVQPLTRWTDADGVVTWVGFAIDGVQAEVLLDAPGLVRLHAPGASVQTLPDGVWRVQLASSEDPQLIELEADDGLTHRVIVLSQKSGALSQRIRLGGVDRLVWSSHPVFLDADGVTLHLQRPATEAGELHIYPRQGLGGDHRTAGVTWAHWSWQAEPALSWALQPTQVQAVGDVPAIQWGPHVSWRDGPVPLVPDEAAHAAAGRWTLTLPDDALAALRAAAGQRLWLTLDLVGDVARLWVDGQVVDDRFCDGSRWQIALDRWLDGGAVPRIELSLLPVAADLPVFLEPAARAAGGGAHLREAVLSLARTDALRPLAGG